MKFPDGNPDQLLKLIADYPLAWLVAGSPGAFDALPLPLLAETDGEGRLTALIGHCSRRNAQVETLRREPRALALFSGPQGYVSPDMVRQPKWVPTWNYAVAAIAVDVEFTDAETGEAVERLVTHAEKGRANPWTIADAGERAAPLLARVIGFRAHVRAVTASFKLGQDESVETLADILDRLEDPALASWMAMFNRDRLPVAAPEEVAR
ncbi:MAG: FMN-binding negative transcriptional regulator [Novosphingobium sp.]|nr:FMN-binding negative transcriptional regulator [Novosphingobium sp.]